MTQRSENLEEDLLPGIISAIREIRGGLRIDCRYRSLSNWRFFTRKITRRFAGKANDRRVIDYRSDGPQRDLYRE